MEIISMSSAKFIFLIYYYILHIDIWALKKDWSVDWGGK